MRFAVRRHAAEPGVFGLALHELAEAIVEPLAGLMVNVHASSSFHFSFFRPVFRGAHAASARSRRICATLTRLPFVRLRRPPLSTGFAE
jgi:hypothetical protein